MRFTTILLSFVLVLALAGSRRAEACGSGNGDYGGIVVAAVVIGGAYVGTTATFAIKDTVSSDHSSGYGVAETAINAPLGMLLGLAMVNEIRDPYTDHGAVKTLAVFTALHGALAAHGVYTIVKNRRRSERAVPQRYDGPPGAMQIGRVTAVVSPAPMHNGAGLGLSGTF